MAIREHSLNEAEEILITNFIKSHPVKDIEYITDGLSGCDITRVDNKIPFCGWVKVTYNENYMFSFYDSPDRVGGLVVEGDSRMYLKNFEFRIFDDVYSTYNPSRELLNYLENLCLIARRTKLAGTSLANKLLLFDAK